MTSHDKTNIRLLNSIEQADRRTIDHQALARAKELEHRLRDTLQTRRTDSNAIITASPR